jgi:hypothetical protein
MLDKYINTEHVIIKYKGFIMIGHLMGLASPVAIATKIQTTNKLINNLLPSSLKVLLAIFLQQLGFFIRYNAFIYFYI